MDIVFAPNTSSLGSPVTPTKLPLRGTPALPNAPKKLIRKFSEADLQEYTPCSKHPRLSACPETAAPEPKTAGISLEALEAEIQRIKLTPLSRGDERTFSYKIKDSSGKCIGWMQITSTFAEEDEGKEYYNDDDGVRMYIYEELSDPGTSSMEATSTLASESGSESAEEDEDEGEEEEEEEEGDYDDTEDENDLTYDSEAFSGTWTSSIAGTASLASLEEGDQIYTNDPQSASEAEMEPMETMPSLGPEDEDMFADDEARN